jgi:SAM-dependent methyltransferase
MPTPGYREDLAHVHDDGFSALAREAAATLLAALGPEVRAPGTIADLGCGSGALAEPVAAAGYRVFGVDLSEPLLERARRRVPSAELVRGSLREVALPPCAAIAAVGEVLNYRFDDGDAAADLDATLERLGRALAPGGLFLFDVAGPGRAAAGGPSRSHFEGEGWAVLVTAEELPAERLLERRITTFRRQGDLWRRSDESHRLRLLDPAEVLAALDRAGFDAEPLAAYGAFRFLPGWSGFLATKR